MKLFIANQKLLKLVTSRMADLFSIQTGCESHQAQIIHRRFL